MADPLGAARFRALGLAGLARAGTPFPDLPARLLVVDVDRQRLGLLEEGVLRFEAPVSTAAKGLGGGQDSYRTPPGWHRVHARIGSEAPDGAVFRGRVPTGQVWRGEASAEDLILTRILTLEGLEEGVNRGPGCDSLDRFIYLHGTNQEGRLGEPCSHGCVRLGNAAVLQLFEIAREGDPVLIAPGGAALGLGRLHFAGVGGSGMSALAQFLALRGGRASGSDRSFDRGLFPAARARLESLGIALHPQDGSGLAGDCSGLVTSTAVEPEVPDFAEAQRRGVPLIHRSELLAHFVAGARTVAVSGTSGKSTTTAMVFELLRGAGRDPSVITGGDLIRLRSEGLWGNAWAGASEFLVVEADESDGSLVRYDACLGLLLNLQRDHKEPAVVLDFFRRFADRLREGLLVGDDPALAALHPGALRFGLGEGPGLRALNLRTGAESSSFEVEGIPFTVPQPGLHNAENAVAALAACVALGVPLGELAAPLAAFQGVARRFQVLGERKGVVVVDDFGHNPAKITASLRTARLRSPRVLAVFQPHGFGPLRFMRAELVDAFAAELGPRDRLWMLEVFYAGGTAAKDLSSAEVVADLQARGAPAAFAPSRERLVEELAAEARDGDLILVMGARDPSLSDLAAAILEAL
ncbi:MAG: L,D-transpeptidase family protein [Acidobacteria bacterium]|nr:L,D-transpeptidase family protein [Acidobacteriota bacterium]